MNPNPKKSFIAHVMHNNNSLSFLEFEDKNHSTGEAKVLTTRLPLPPTGPQRAATFLIAYFECYDDYYTIQIRSHTHFENYISKNVDGKLAAVPGAGTQATSFNLLDDNHKIITLDDLASPKANVHLKARNAGIIKINKKKINQREIRHFNDNSGDTFKFNLEILQRNPAESTDPKPDRLYYYYDGLNDD